MILMTLVQALRECFCRDEGVSKYFRGGGGRNSHQDGVGWVSSLMRLKQTSASMRCAVCVCVQCVPRTFVTANLRPHPKSWKCTKLCPCLGFWRPLCFTENIDAIFQCQIRRQIQRKNAQKFSGEPAKSNILGLWGCEPARSPKTLKTSK